MGGLTRDGMTEPVSQGQILRREWRGYRKLFLLLGLMPNLLNVVTTRTLLSGPKPPNQVHFCLEAITYFKPRALSPYHTTVGHMWVIVRPSLRLSFSWSVHAGNGRVAKVIVCRVRSRSRGTT